MTCIRVCKERRTRSASSLREKEEVESPATTLEQLGAVGKSHRSYLQEIDRIHDRMFLCPAKFPQGIISLLYFPMTPCLSK